MAFIIITSIIIYFILIAWTWQSLGFIEKNKKIIFILIGIVLMYVITYISFQIAQNGINYQKVEIKNKIQNVLLTIFTGINGVIIMPQVSKILNKVKEDGLKKEKLIKTIVVLMLICIPCLIFENRYMKNTQEGILKVYDAMIEE